MPPPVACGTPLCGVSYLRAIATRSGRAGTPGRSRKTQERRNMSRTRRLVRLFAVVAILAGVLVPAAAASAQIDDYECWGETWQATNPDHILYGRSVAGQATAPGPYGSTKMVVDLRGMTPVSANGFYVIWDGYFTPGTNGVIIYGSSSNDTICGTGPQEYGGPEGAGQDWIWGFQGNDRIFGFGATEGYSTQTVTVGTTTFTPGSDLGDHLAGGKGHDFISTGWDGVGLAPAGRYDRQQQSQGQRRQQHKETQHLSPLRIAVLHCSLRPNSPRVVEIEQKFYPWFMTRKPT